MSKDLIRREILKNFVKFWELNLPLASSQLNLHSDPLCIRVFGPVAIGFPIVSYRVVS
jgi:hypothetical protein